MSQDPHECSDTQQGGSRRQGVLASTRVPTQLTSPPVTPCRLKMLSGSRRNARLKRPRLSALRSTRPEGGNTASDGPVPPAPEVTARSRRGHGEVTAGRGERGTGPDLEIGLAGTATAREETEHAEDEHFSACMKRKSYFVPSSPNECEKCPFVVGTRGGFHSGTVSKEQLERRQTAIYNIYTFRMLILCILHVCLPVAAPLCAWDNNSGEKGYFGNSLIIGALKGARFLTMSPRLLDDN